MARKRTSQHLSKPIIDRLKYNGDGTSRDVVWDDEIRGLGIRIYPSGRRVFILSYRAGRRKRLLTIGEFGPLTVAQARKAATIHKGEVIAGKDPVIERKAGNGQRTVKNLCANYLKEAKASNRNENSYKIDERNVRNHIIPRIGGLSVADVESDDVIALYRAVRDGKTARPRPETQLGGATVTGGTVVANRVLALSSSLFSYAESLRWRPVGSNPSRGVKRAKEVARERFLSDQELAGLGDAINKAEADGESVYAIAAIRLLIFTGARLREILNLEWEWVDLERAVLNLPLSKTGKKVIHLPPPALSILASLPRTEKNPFVIVGERPGRPLVNLQKPWTRIRNKAGLQNVRIHDLRHSFASVGASGGASLLVIGKLLGHARQSTTERYAHLAADPVKAAADAIGERIAAAMKGEGSTVVPMKRKA